MNQQDGVNYYDKNEYGPGGVFAARMQQARGPSAILRGENDGQWSSRVQNETKGPVTKEYMHTATVRRATERKLGSAANRVGDYLDAVMPKQMGFTRAEVVVTTFEKIPHLGTVPVGRFLAKKKDGTQVALVATIANFQADVDTGGGKPQFKNMPKVKDGETPPGMYIGTAWTLKPDGSLDKIDPDLGTKGVMFTTAKPEKLAEFYCGLAGLKPKALPAKQPDASPQSRPLSGLRAEIEADNRRVQSQDRVQHRQTRSFG